jgi:hypothetical protein
MPISSEQIKLLESYRDKTYITSIIYSQSVEHCRFLRSIINIPLILSCSTMTVLNSMDNNVTGGGNNNMKYANIVLNTWTSLILSLVGNFKLPEQATNFVQIQVKMNKLCHQIEDKLTIDLESCKIEDIRHFINEYDALYEKLDYVFPNFIKNRVKKIYSGKKVLPNILNCEISFVKIDEV